MNLPYSHACEKTASAGIAWPRWPASAAENHGPIVAALSRGLPWRH